MLTEHKGKPVRAKGPGSQRGASPGNPEGAKKGTGQLVGVRLPLTRTISVRDSVHGPMRELVDRLLSPVPMQEFLAQREVVRRAQARAQPRRPLRQLA